MKTAVAIVAIVLMIALPILVIIMLGKRFSRRFLERSPDGEFVKPLTKTGIALNVCLVLLLSGFSASQLAPESTLGLFLRTLRGAVAGLVTFLVGFAAAELAFKAVGHPPRRP